MKISKVGHTRMAISASSGSVGGIIYDTPENQNEKLQSRVSRAIEKAKKLYNPFNGNAIYDKKKFPDECAAEKQITILAREVAGELTGIYTCAVPDIGLLKHSLKGAYNANKDSVNLCNFTLGFVQELCHKKLKKSLRRIINDNGEQYILEEIFCHRIIEKLGKEFCSVQKNDVKRNAENRILKERLLQDRNKGKQLKYIASSIENNDVRVQVDCGHGEPRLVPAGAVHSNARKRAMFQFVKAYASADKEGQASLVNHMKAMLILFVCGESRYLDAIEYNGHEWSWNGIIPDNNENISSAIYSYLQEIESLQVDSERKADIEGCRTNIAVETEAWLTNSYRNAKKILEKYNGSASEFDLYWLKYFQDGAARLLQKKTSLVTIGSAYICRHLFREWKSFVAMKFVEMGKAVYHFATPEEFNKDTGAVWGRIRPELVHGITSFDYERIKAQESLARNLAVSATYAAAVFSNSVVDVDTRNEITARKLKENRREYDASDVLMYEDDEFTAALRKDARKRILQFFGGQSSWPDLKYEADDIASALKDAIKNLRNYSYHFGTRFRCLKDDSECVISDIFDIEYGRLSAMYATKYYTNNVPQFYSKDDIIKLFNLLYSKEIGRPAQIPAFANVLPRKEAADFIYGTIAPGMKNRSNISDAMKEKFRSSLYFVLKEIYYNGFLQENDGELKSRFFKAVSDNRPVEGSKSECPYNDFMQRISGLRNMSFGEICQQIMTDVNQQNQGKKSIKTSERRNKDMIDGKKDIYQHFKMLLLLYIRTAFKDYVGRKAHEEFAFLKKPRSVEANMIKPSLEEFLDGGWRAENFSHLREIFATSPMLMSWYIAAHFVPPKQLNLLKGDIREYRQFLGNINHRAHITGNRTSDISYSEIYEEVLNVIEFVALFNGRISSNVEDYFESDYAYQQYLEDNFFDFDLFKHKGEASGLFFDESNAILNRGVVISSMYGMDKIVSGIGYKLTIKDYDRYYKKLKPQTAKFLSTGKCEDMEQQLMVNEYQSLKKRLNLHDILDYTEMVMDHMGQLVSYAYMRGRDLMYFQLGMHYIRLYHGDSVPSDSHWRVLKGKKVDIADGALLYDIISMYTPDMNMFGFDNKTGNVVNDGQSGSAGSGVYKFLKLYSGNRRGRETFLHGLSLFVRNPEKDGGEYDRLVELRNEIDHMKYLSGSGKSIVDYYSAIYNGFFDYNTNLKKSVSFIFKNIMMRYFLMPSLRFVRCEEDGIYRIAIQGIKSDKFTYKFKDKPLELSQPKPVKGKNVGKGGKSDSDGNGGCSDEVTRKDKLKYKFDYAKSEVYISSAHRLLEFKF